MEVVESTENGVIVRVRVRPKASKNAVSAEPGRRVRIAVTAPPEDGAANKAVVKLLAKTVGVPKSAVKITHGGKGRDKTLSLDGTDVETVRRMLGA